MLLSIDQLLYAADLLATQIAIPTNTRAIPDNFLIGRSTLSPRHIAVAAVNTNVSALHRGTATEISAMKTNGG